MSEWYINPAQSQHISSNVWILIDPVTNEKCKFSSEVSRKDGISVWKIQITRADHTRNHTLKSGREYWNELIGYGWLPLTDEFSEITE